MRGANQAEPSHARGSLIGMKKPPADIEQKLDEALKGTFPASDPFWLEPEHDDDGLPLERKRLEPGGPRASSARATQRRRLK
jgi:hypothetical protein